MAVDDISGDPEFSGSSQDTPLEDLFSQNPEPEDRKSSSADEDDGRKEKKEEASQKVPESEASPSDKKAEAKPKDEKKAADKDLPEKEETKPAESDEQKAEREAKEKWEQEDNPYFKRYKDTASNWQKEHQEKLQLQTAVSQMQHEMTLMRKIADGTYDPEVDNPQQPQVTPEMIAQKALNVGKVLASRNAAVAQHGAEEVDSRLAQFSQLFDGNEMINQIVLESEAPVQQAFHILERYKFESTYGSTPAEWHKNIRAEAEKELRVKIKEEVTDELMGRADKKQNTPRGLSSSRGSNGLSFGQNSKGKGQRPLSDIFSR